MPYRRLPNTDVARIRAINAAIRMGEKLLPSELAFSSAHYVKAKSFLPAFLQAVDTHNKSHTNQAKNNKAYIESFKKVKLYLSHFVQVLNLAIIRKEIPEPDRKYYGIEKSDKRVPNMNTENQVLEWGKKIIAGETERVAKSGNAILSPRIAVVKVWYDKYVDCHRFQRTLQDINVRALTKVVATRAEADKLILNIWNEVEEKFSKLSPEEMRTKAKDYGIIYVLRKNEKMKADSTIIQFAKTA